jgi:hypothetical protein
MHSLLSVGGLIIVVADARLDRVLACAATQVVACVAGTIHYFDDTTAVVVGFFGSFLMMFITTVVVYLLRWHLS